MKLFSNNQPEKPVRKRKAKTNSWFRNQVKNSGALLDSVKETKLSTNVTATKKLTIS